MQRKCSLRVIGLRDFIKSLRDTHIVRLTILSTRPTPLPRTCPSQNSTSPCRLDHFCFIHTSKPFSLGPIDASTVEKVVKEVTPEEKRRLALMDARPPIDTIFNLHDFENVAKLVLPDKAWVRHRSALSPPFDSSPN